MFMTLAAVAAAIALPNVPVAEGCRYIDPENKYPSAVMLCKMYEDEAYQFDKAVWPMISPETQSYCVAYYHANDWQNYRNIQHCVEGRWLFERSYNWTGYKAKP